MTPTPDEPQTRPDDPDAPPAPRPFRRGSSDSATSDEISVLLSSSLDGAEPDPMLGGSSSWDLARMARKQAQEAEAEHAAAPTSGLDVGVDLSVAPAPPDWRSTDGEGAERYDWAGLVLRSYASAVTLGLAWLLWSGKSTPPAPPREAPVPAPRRRTAEPAPAAIAPVVANTEAEAVRTTALGKPILVGDLEVTPLLVLRKAVTVVRDLGEEALIREHAGCLALTVRLKNLSDSQALTPIATADLIDGDGFAIDAGAGTRIAMFALAPGSEWKVEEQEFPEIAPGEVADVVLLSEPLGDRRLPASMTWRFRVATDPERTRRESLGVTFGPNDLP